MESSNIINYKDINSSPYGDDLPTIFVLGVPGYNIFVTPAIFYPMSFMTTHSAEIYTFEILELIITLIPNVNSQSTNVVNHEDMNSSSYDGGDFPAADASVITDQ